MAQNTPKRKIKEQEVKALQARLRHHDDIV